MVKIILILFCTINAFVLAVPTAKKIYYDIDKAEDYFKEFIITHGREYENEEEKQMRLLNFVEFLKNVNKMNIEEEHAMFGITKFADLTIEEFHKKYGCLAPLNTTSCKVIKDKDITTKTAPEELDWRQLNKVTKVKEQGICGSCWAFSSVGSIEGSYALKHNELVEFSEQQLVSCDKQNNGCAGGLMSIAFESLINMGGVVTENDYPYEGEAGTCHFDKSKVKTKVTGCNSYLLQDEEKLKEVLYTMGPLAIAVDSTSFSSYHGGVMHNCVFNKIGHGVVLVGYGTEKLKGEEVPYWIIKNSWGDSEGEQGYYRLRRGVNACGLMNKFMASAVIA